jgi:4-hydroxy-tetrahydrodipicolinate reductase
MSLRVAVCGALGNMGRETCQAVARADDLELAALVDKKGGEWEGHLVWQGLAEALADVKPTVCVDFTHPDVAVANALTCLELGVAPVIGTSGLDEAGLQRIREAAAETPALVVPNFAIGAILMMRFAEMAARWMPEAAIVELHRFEKPDAPSGTAMHTAERIGQGRNAPQAERPQPPEERLVKSEGALGATVAGVPVHSVRLPGLLAHQEVLFGSPGETLTIRHDSMHRSSFMPGVLLAVRRVRSLQGLTVGLESLMFGP